MTIYFRSENVPELADLSSLERRVMLRGTFLKERTLSSLVLMFVVLGSVHFIINPLLIALLPVVRNNSFFYMAVLVSWLILMMRVRDVVLMNMLRPKIAAKRAEAVARQAVGTDAAA